MREAQLQFLCLRQGGDAAHPVQACIPERHLREKLAGALAPGPAALVVKNRDLAGVLEALGDCALDRGAKHPAVPLARLATGQNGIAVIRGPYTSSGQLLRSLRAFLMHAIRRGDTNGCVIGVAESVFKQVWQRGDTRRNKPTAVSEAPAGNANLLRMLLHDSEPDYLTERPAGTSPHIRLVRQLIVRAAKTRQPVLILGDVGAGKNVAAQAIHDLSHGQGDFVSANCIALAAGRFEAELFGETRRSGIRGRPVTAPGLWGQAGEGGTIYLDEVSALRLSQQAQLNDALRTGEIRHPGGRILPLPDAQVVVSSARDLGSLARSGEFLADLFYRLREFTIQIPPLRDRPEDIPILARNLWTELAGEKAAPPAEKILSLLQSYPWPGNVRELKTVLSSLHTLFSGGKLTPEHVRIVMAGQGYPALLENHHDRKLEQEAERMRCARHLLRAEEIVLSLQRALRTPAAKRGRARKLKVEAPAIETIGRLLAELELLFFTPALFGSVETYTLMNALKGKVHYCHDLCTHDRDGAMQFLQKDLADALTATALDLRKEISRLLE